LSTQWQRFAKIFGLIFIFIFFPGGILTASATQPNHSLSTTYSDLNSKHFATMLQPKGVRSFGGSIVDYDEQIGNTFAQSFTSMAYNVTAVAQVDSDGCGPAYLLNGLSNVGYWYQVGLSYDWNCATSGFTMAYEVFDSSHVSIFPTSGGGGTLSYTGAVNSGDLVLLNLYFGIGSFTGEVVMYSYDWNTGAYASETYSNEGASYFAGLSNEANANGFFTGLMTEQYHSSPYYGSEQFVAYSDQQYALSSAWQWIDEYNIATNQSLFYSASDSPVAFDNFHQLHEFSSNGATEFADAYVLDTGADPVSISLSYQPILVDAGMQSVASFSASASGGTAPYDYLLFLDNDLLTSYSSANGAYQGTVNFGLLSAGAHGYYVDVIDSNGYPASSQSVGFQVANDPSTSIAIDKKTIDVGQSDTFSGSLQGGSPGYTLTWYVNGQQIVQQQTSTSSTNYGFNSTLAGNFTVFANLVDSADFSTNSTSHIFTVNQDPKMSWNISPQSNDFFYSNNVVTSSAVVSGGTSPYTYSWYLNGAKISQGTSPNYSYSLSQMGQNKLQLNVSDSAGFVLMSSTYSVNYGYDLVNIGLLICGIAAALFVGVFFFLRRPKNSL
jgi:hypothetical protein